MNQATINSPLLDYEFWCLLAKYFGSGDEMICLARRDNQLVASTIVEPLGVGRWQTFTPPQAPLGAWLIAESVTPDSLLTGLACELPGPVLSIGITRQDPSFVTRPEATKRLSTIDYVQTGGINLHYGFDQYWRERGRNLRQNLRRQRNRLRRVNIKTELSITRDPTLIGERVDSYGTLESSGWKAQGGTALHPSNTQGHFYRELFEHFGKRGESVVYEYWYDSSPVAIDLCLERGGILVILKTTHDESQITTSPAMLMREESLRCMHGEDGIHRVEFYGKRMDWHARWTNDFRTLYHVNYDMSLLLSLARRLRGAIPLLLEIGRT